MSTDRRKIWIISFGGLLGLVMGSRYFGNLRLPDEQPIETNAYGTTRPEPLTTTHGAARPGTFAVSQTPVKSDSASLSGGSLERSSGAPTEQGITVSDSQGDQSDVASSSMPESPELGEERGAPADRLPALPFPVSDSVQESCNRYPDACKTEFALLKKMEKEPLDAAWAKRMEQILRESAVSHPGEVRALECRATVCAMEVASGQPGYQGLSDAHAIGLLPLGDAYGIERTRDGQLVSVSLNVWERHDPNH